MGKVQGPTLRPLVGSRGQRPPVSYGFLPILNALGELSWTVLICIFMIKKDTNYEGRKYTNGKGEVYELLCLDLKQVACFKYNFLLSLLHYVATNRKLDGNWKIIANVTHF